MSDWRTSRLRRQDFAHLLRFQYPVRCRSCGKRAFTSLLHAYEIKRQSALRHALAKRNS
jgi:hypothetical protein